MALDNFIPTVWSETLYEELQNNYVGVKLSSREYEGEIKNHGDRVKITGLNPVTVFDYKKNTDMPLPQQLDSTTTTLTIDQAKGFNFYIDDIDNIQSSPKLLRAAMKKAADALSDEADRYIYSLTDGRIETVHEPNLSKDNILDIISGMRRSLLYNNVPNTAKLSLEISPCVEQMLIMANVLTATNNSEVLSKGYVGSVLGFDVYVSNNLYFGEAGTRCVARTKRAISFAEQICSIKTYEPERRNGTAVKGLHLYGAKIVYPGEIIFLDSTQA